MTGTVEGRAEQLEGHGMLEGWRAQGVLSSPSAAGCVQVCPSKHQIPVLTEVKHPGRGQRQTQHHFVHFPPLLPGESQESAGEGSLQVRATSFIHELLSCSSSSLEHPMDETPQRSHKRAPQPQILPLPRGLQLFAALPPLECDAKAGSELSVLPPGVRASPEPLAELGQRILPGPKKFPVSR